MVDNILTSVSEANKQTVTKNKMMPEMEMHSKLECLTNRKDISTFSMLCRDAHNAYGDSDKIQTKQLTTN